MDLAVLLITRTLVVPIVSAEIGHIMARPSVVLRPNRTVGYSICITSSPGSM